MRQAPQFMYKLWRHSSYCTYSVLFMSLRSISGCACVSCSHRLWADGAVASCCAPGLYKVVSSLLVPLIKTHWDVHIFVFHLPLITSHYSKKQNVILLFLQTILRSLAILYSMRHNGLICTKIMGTEGLNKGGAFTLRVCTTGLGGHSHW